MPNYMQWRKLGKCAANKKDEGLLGTELTEHTELFHIYINFSPIIEIILNMKKSRIWDLNSEFCLEIELLPRVFVNFVPPCDDLQEIKKFLLRT